MKNLDLLEKFIFVLSFVVLAIGIFTVWCWFDGVIISFVSHPLTGLIVLVAEPSAVIIGAADILFDCNLAEMITDKFIK